MAVDNLSWLRGVPVIGPRLYESLTSLNQGLNNVALQTNSNPNGDPPAPPPIQAVHVTGQNGFLHVAITDQNAGVSRGTKWYVEHADNPGFTNSQTIEVGDPRNHTVFLGNVTRFVRAYSANGPSAASPPVAYGGAAPIAVALGGPIGGPGFLPSQGTGTGAPGQGGLGPGPIQSRQNTSGFDWRKQRPIFSGSPGLLAAQIAGGEFTQGGGSGGGGGGTPTISFPPIYNLFFLGDSLSTGAFSSTGNPYPSKVGKRLNLSPNFIHNLGVNGAKTADILTIQVPQAVAGYNPSLGVNWAICQGGVNDFLNSVSIATTQANIIAINAALQAAGFTVLWLTNFPQNDGGTYASFETWRDTMRAWWIAGTSNSNYFINVGDQPYMSNPAWTQWYNADQLHLEDLGYLVGMAQPVASFLIASLGGDVALLPPQTYAAATPMNTNFTEYGVSIEQYGCLAGSMGIPSWNTKALGFAFNAALAAGVDLYAPGEYYNVDKTNLYPKTGSQSLTFRSTCSNPPANALACPGTRFVCSGNGTSWLPGVLNFATPNGGNTGPSTTAQTFGLRTQGIFGDTVAGVSFGIFLSRQYMFQCKDSGVAPNATAGWGAGIQLDTCVVGQMYSPYCSGFGTSGGVGIALGSPSYTGTNAYIDIYDTVIVGPGSGGSSVGVAAAFSKYCTLFRGTIQSCGIAVETASPRFSMLGTLCGTGGATNGVDFKQLAGFTNDFGRVVGCTLNSPVQLAASVGTEVLDNECYSTLTIAATATSVVLNQQLKMFTGITDLSATTYYTGACVQGVGAPTGSQGIRTQFYLDTSTSHLWQCTVTAVPGVATWVDVSSGVSFPITVANGGTGDVTLANHGVLVGQGTAPVHVTAAGTAGQALISNGASADPTFQGNPPLGALTTGKTLATGVAFFASGTVSVATGLSSVVTALALLAGTGVANEYMWLTAVSGGTITFASSDPASARAFSWMAFGS